MKPHLKRSARQIAERQSALEAKVKEIWERHVNSFPNAVKWRSLLRSVNGIGQLLEQDYSDFKTWAISPEGRAVIAFDVWKAARKELQNEPKS